jgi:hypothetical protein
MFAFSKAADLSLLVQGGQLYWAFPFQQGFPDDAHIFSDELMTRKNLSVNLSTNSISLLTAKFYF